MENENQGFNNANDPDELHIGLKILSFCIPLAGAIIYFTTDRVRYPNKGKQACYAALIGVGVGILIQVLFMVLGIGAAQY